MVRTISLALVLVLLAGCYSALNGQRVSLSHHEAAGEFHILIHNDGIHGVGDDPAKSAEEVAGVLDEGGLFWWEISDWLSSNYLSPAYGADDDSEADGGSEADDASEVSPRLTKMDELTEVSTLGHYFDGKGRIGALQLVRIRRLDEYVGAANAALREGDPEEYLGPLMPKTLALIVKEAKAGRDWLDIQGHSIVVSIPADETEWKQEVERSFQRGREPTPESPFSVTCADGRVTMRLGRIDRPSTYRARYRDVPKTDLDAQVKTSAPANIDRRMLAALLGGPKPETAPEIRMILDAGPPEERARALLRGVVHEDPDVREESLTRLRAFGVAWNRAARRPVAPKAARKLQAEIDAWWDWYDVIIRKPMHPPRKRAPAAQSKRK